MLRSLVGSEMCIRDRYNLAPPGLENRSAGQNGVLPDRTNGYLRIYVSPIYIIWHLRVAKIVLPGRTAFFRAERHSAGQNEWLYPYIYIFYIYKLAPPGRENRSAWQNAVLPGRTNGYTRTYITFIYIIWHLWVAKIVPPFRTAFCMVERMIISVHIYLLYI